VIEEREPNAGNGVDVCECCEVPERKWSCPVGRVSGGRITVLPRVDEEAVKATDYGEEKSRCDESHAEIRAARDGGDEGSGGETDSNGELFGEAVRAAGCVDNDEVAKDESAEDEVQVDALRGDVWEKKGEDDGCADDP
jgi:hypothetical protein